MFTSPLQFSETLPAFASVLAARLAAAVRPASAMPSADGLALTPETLRADLLAMGARADAVNLALAEAFARLGVPLTPETLTDAHAALVRAPDASPLAYALARTLDLPATPVTLRALSAVTGDLPNAGDAPATLTTDTADAPEILAATLHQFIRHDAPRRAALLHLTQTTGERETSGDALLNHLAGQQIVNEAAQKSPNPTPFYFAVPVNFGQEAAMLELRLWPEKEEARRRGEDENGPILRATLRLETEKLGRVQADLTGESDGNLRCEFLADRAATARLLSRHTGQLVESLTQMGWPKPTVACAQKRDDAPLWHGGDRVSAPRRRVDRRA